MDHISEPRGADPIPPPIPDDRAIDVTIDINRELTPDEIAAIADLKESIVKVNAAVKALPDNALLSLPNGAHATGAQVKAAWKNTDFVIVDRNAGLPNDSERGAADPNHGNPIVTFRINIVDQYNDNVGGTNYLVAHELGHLTQAAIFQGTGRSTWYHDEVTANDISRAILNGAGLPFLPNPLGGGYSPDAPIVFTVSNKPADDGSGGGPGGGGGGWTDPEPLQARWLGLSVGG